MRPVPRSIELTIVARSIEYAIARRTRKSRSLGSWKLNDTQYYVVPGALLTARNLCAVSHGRTSISTLLPEKSQTPSASSSARTVGSGTTLRRIVVGAPAGDGQYGLRSRSRDSSRVYPT